MQASATDSMSVRPEECKCSFPGRKIRGRDLVEVRLHATSKQWACCLRRKTRIGGQVDRGVEDKGQESRRTDVGGVAVTDVGRRACSSRQEVYAANDRQVYANPTL
jgi:hypothetical protein